MLFQFLKYLQPTHYFRLFQTSGASVFPQVEALPELVLEQLLYDEGYESEHARDYDLSWQAIQNGYVGNVETYTQFEILPLADEYRFIRKQFHPVWVFYVLFCRLCTFHNPFKEIQAWVVTAKTKRVASVTALTNEAWNHYKSQLLEQAPLVSVVIPTLNRYDYLKDVLQDFEKQDYPHFEVLVVDQSEPFQPHFYKQFPLHIRVIRQEEKALWLARNTAIKEAQGDLIALSEDDVRIPNNWISNHLRCLDFFKAQVSAGVFYPEGQEIPKARSFFAVASQFATGNAMLYKEVFYRVGLFDRQFEKQRMGDGEFGLRVYLEGMLSVSNPYASCIDVKAGTGGLRELGSWDAFRPSNFFAPRPIPSVLYYYRTYYGDRAARWALLRTIPTSLIPYQFKKNKGMLVLGLFLSILLLPLVLYQVLKSWNLASKKIKEGALIEKLE